MPADARPDPSTVPVRPASTVVLVRDGAAGPEVFALTRVSTMVFAAGATAFPGGGLDPSDHDLPPWTGRSAEDWNAVLAREDGAALLVAAVRELFEEVGVLLADPVPELEPAAWDLARDDLASHRGGLGGLFRSLSTALPGDLPVPWSRWITPVGPPRRYDTYFMVVPLPAGQLARVHTTEAETGGWFRPAQLIDLARAGEIDLMPPTLMTVGELADFDSVSALTASRRSLEPVEPEFLRRPGGGVQIRVGDRVFDLKGGK